MSYVHGHFMSCSWMAEDVRGRREKRKRPWYAGLDLVFRIT